jgi:hypothetical protein
VLLRQLIIAAPSVGGTQRSSTQNICMYALPIEFRGGYPHEE